MKNDEILSKNLENQEIKTDISEKGNCIIKCSEQEIDSEIIANKKKLSQEISDTMKKLKKLLDQYDFSDHDRIFEILGIIFWFYKSIEEISNRSGILVTNFVIELFRKLLRKIKKDINIKKVF